MRCQTRVSPRGEVGTWQTSDTACGGDDRGREHRRAEQATIRRGRNTVKPATIVEEPIPCQTDPISY